MRLLLAFLLILPFSAQARQAVSMASSAAEDEPIRIQAEDGIQWLRKERRIRTLGHSTATQGDLKLTAEELSAHYGEENDRSVIERIKAERAVHITGPDIRARAGTAIFFATENRIVLSGTPARFLMAVESLSGESLEYLRDENTVIATGKASLKREGRTLSAKKLTAHLVDSPTKGEEPKLKTLKAEKNVIIRTETETIRGESGIYTAATDMAVLEGPVEITHGENTLKGARARVNLATGVSTLLSGPVENGEKERVRGFLLPDSRKKDTTPAKGPLRNREREKSPSGARP